MKPDLKAEFYNLNPELIMATAEMNGFQPTGELIQLNSYENRVFEIRLEDGDSIIAKYYRPQRWSRETILAEHAFTKELSDEAIEVAPAYILKNNTTVETVDQIHYAFFEKIRGRMVQELTEPHYKKIGRWLARLHNVGAKKKAPQRATIGPTSDNKWEALDRLLEKVAPEVVGRYEEAAIRIFENLDDELVKHQTIRLHGDLHRGNILELSNNEFVIVDFDDMVNGPEVQDLWMLLPGADYKNSEEINWLIKSYNELREFPMDQLDLVPLLRGYRIITYAMWIQNRWTDPSFPRLFPNFGSYSYWAEETESLERIAFTIANS